MKNKISFFLKKHRYTVYTCIISILLLNILFFIKKIFPYGTNNFIKIDFFHQYYPMMVEFIERISSFKSLDYSFNTGLGMPFFRNVLNYLSSPLNILVFFFKTENLADAFSILIGTKVIASCTIMSLFLNKKINKSLLSVPLSVAYGFSSYFIAYNWNIMWTDGMIFLPLVAMGIENIIIKKKYGLYGIVLGISIFSNYYVGYTLCLFSGIYFIIFYILSNKLNIKNFIKSFIKFITFSFLIVGLLCFVLIPIYCSLDTISATKDLFPNIFSTEFSFIQFLFNSFSGVIPTELISDNIPLPNIASSTIVLILIPAYFLNKNIKPKEKIIYFVLLLVMFLSHYLSPLNFIWHGFHNPNDLPYRVSYMFIFVTIIIAYKSLIKIKDISLTTFSYIFIAITSMLIVAKITKFTNVENWCFIFNLVLLIIYWFLFMASKHIRILKKIVPILLIVISCAEVSYVSYNNVHVESITSLKDDYTSNKFISDLNYLNSNNFYRIEKSSSLTYNDGALNNYYGMSIFSSMAYQSVAEFQKNFGNAGNYINSFNYKTQTNIYNSIFGIKYIIGTVPNSSYYEYANDFIAQYRYPLSISFAVDKKIKDFVPLYHLPFQNQNKFIEFSANIYDVLIPLDFNISNGEFTDENEIVSNDDYINFSIVNTRNGEIYIYADSYNIYSIEINDTYYQISKNEPYIINIGNHAVGDVIEGTIYFDSDDNEDYTYFYAYASNDEKFKFAYDILSKNQLKIKDFKDNNIKGTITVDEDASVFSSIAYDEGWKVYVDGIEVKTYKIGESYMGYDISKGTHSIQYVYKPKGFKLGIIVSSFSAITITILVILRKKMLKF